MTDARTMAREWLARFSALPAAQRGVAIAGLAFVWAPTGLVMAGLVLTARRVRAVLDATRKP